MRKGDKENERAEGKREWKDTMLEPKSNIRFQFKSYNCLMSEERHKYIFIKAVELNLNIVISTNYHLQYNVILENDAVHAIG